MLEVVFFRVILGRFLSFTLLKRCRINVFNDSKDMGALVNT